MTKRPLDVLGGLSTTQQLVTCRHAGRGATTQTVLLGRLGHFLGIDLGDDFVPAGMYEAQLARLANLGDRLRAIYIDASPCQQRLPELEATPSIAQLTAPCKLRGGLRQILRRRRPICQTESHATFAVPKIAKCFRLRHGREFLPLTRLVRHGRGRDRWRSRRYILGARYSRYRGDLFAARDAADCADDQHKHDGGRRQGHYSGYLARRTAPRQGPGEPRKDVGTGAGRGFMAMRPSAHITQRADSS